MSTEKNDVLYATEIFFDDAFSRRIKLLWKQFSEKRIDSHMSGIRGLRPHVTLGMYTEIDENAFRLSMKNFESVFVPISVKMDMIAAFPGTGTWFSNPTVTRQLLDMHEMYYHIMEAFSESASPYYLPGNWNPHCTLATGLSSRQLKKAFGFVLDHYVATEAQLTETALFRITRKEAGKTFSLKL